MRKPRKSNWLILCCIGLVVAAGALLTFLQFDFVTKDQVSPSGSNPMDASRVVAFEDGREGNLDRESIEEALAEFAETKSTFHRNKLLFSLLDGANHPDLQEILAKSESIERISYRIALQTAAIRKLATIDPVHALRWIAVRPKTQRGPLLERVFQEWSMTNLHDAVQSAMSLTRRESQIALGAILSTRTDLPVADIIAIGSELGHEEIALQRISKSQTLRLVQDPSSAWEFLVNDGIDDSMQLDLLKLVASAWKERDGFDVLLQAQALFPNKNQISALTAVVEAIVGTDIESAFAYLRTQSRAARGALPIALATVAARVDPNIALSQIAQWSDDPVHLHLQKSVANTWARSDPRAMLGQFENLPQVTRVEAAQIAFTRLAYESPEDAIEYMEATKGYFRSGGFIALIIAQQWSRADPEAALEWSLSYSEENTDLRRAFVQRVFRSFVSSNPQRALELVQDFEELTSSRIHVTQADYDVVWELTRMGRIDDAIALLPRLDDHPRHFAIDELGHALVRAGDPYGAMELGIDIPSLDAPLIGPATYFTRIFDAWATRDSQHLFQSLGSFTSPVLRSMAAKELISRQDSTPTLTEDEIKSAQEVLSERPLTGNVLKLELEMRAEAGLIDLDNLVVPDEWLEE